MRKPKFAWLAMASMLAVACATITPAATTTVTPLPGTSLAQPSALAASPGVSGLATDAPETSEPTSGATPTVAPIITPKPTPKPTRKPTATATAIAGDIEVSFEQTSIPDPFYSETDYAIRVYISALGQQDLPNVKVKLVAKDEGVSYRFETGPIAITDTYYHDVIVNLPAIGPSALILSASMPDGYADTNKANNTKSVDIYVTPAP